MKVKIHCFEGEWDQKHPELSVRPLIHVLEQSYLAAGSELTYSYKFCQTVKRLETELERLDGRKLNSQKQQHCLYFAFHGDGKGLYSSELTDQLSYEDIAKSLQQKASGSIIFFGSCGARRSSEATLQAFKDETGAKLVVGYASNVDWITSSAYEMLFFSELCRSDYKQPKRLINKLGKIAGPSNELFASLNVIIV